MTARNTAVGAYRVAQHEAAHCAVACELGLDVTGATIGDTHGVVNVTADHGRLFEHLVCALSGMVIEGDPIQWPPRQRGEDGDERACWVLVEQLQLGRDDWDRATELAQSLLALKAVRDAVRSISVALLARGTISGDECRMLVAESWSRRESS